MDYQIIVISEMHHDASRNAVKGSIPLNIDSFDMTQTILLLGSTKHLTHHQGVAALERLRTAGLQTPKLSFLSNCFSNHGDATASI